MRMRALALSITLILAATPALGFAQGKTSREMPGEMAQNPPLEIGATAPDFELPGATRFGTLEDPVRLSDFKGKTVVLAFFFRARTPG